MGIFDSISNFLDSRGDDFVKLEETDEAFGPGPALILYKVPSTIEDDEIQDMLSDGAPRAAKKGITLARITNDQDSLLTQTLDESLNDLTSGKVVKSNIKGDLLDAVVSRTSGSGCPVLFFSGFQNQEMMAAYNIVGGEIYQENGEAAACAKAVPASMLKPLGQVLDEISGDHEAAMNKGDE